MKRRIFVALVVMLVAVSASTGVLAADFKIGVSLQGLDSPYIVLLADAMKAKAEEMGVKMTILDGESRPEKQIAQVENFIVQQYDVIIINPISLDGCAPAVDAAVKANIPIFTLITKIKNQEQCVTYVGSDAPESGKMQGELIAAALNGKGNIALIRGPIGHDAEIGRFKGLEEVFANYPDIKIVVDQTGNWQRDQGLSLMENWLQSGKQIDAVAAQNDNMALGALKAIEDAKLLGTIQVFGIDANQDALQAVKAGSMQGTVFQNAKAQGEKAVEIAVKIANKEAVDSLEYIPYEKVDSTNVDQYIEK